MRDMLNGTVLLIENVGMASKLGTGNGWLVKSLIGKVYPSARWGAATDEMTHVRQVATKAAARRALSELQGRAEASCGEKTTC